MTTSKSLVGRQVYFKLSKVKCEELHIALVPEQLYTVVEQDSNNDYVNIYNPELNSTPFINRKGCAHLKGHKWILKRLPKTK